MFASHEELVEGEEVGVVDLALVGDMMMGPTSPMFAFPPGSIAMPDLEASRVFDFEKFRTVTCNAYRRGKVCAFAQRCFFAHGPNELRRNPYKEQYSPELCPAAKETKSCHHGPTCKFSRNFTEYLYHPKRYKTRLCDNYLKGRCERSDTCAFIHDTRPAFSENISLTMNVGFQGQRPPLLPDFIRLHAVNPIVALLNSGGGILSWGVELDGEPTGMDLRSEDIVTLQNLLMQLMSNMNPPPKPDRCLFQAHWEAAPQAQRCILKIQVTKGDVSEIYFNDQSESFVSKVISGSVTMDDIFSVEGPALVELCRKRFIGSRSHGMGEGINGHPSLHQLQQLVNMEEVMSGVPPHLSQLHQMQSFLQANGVVTTGMSEQTLIQSLHQLQLNSSEMMMNQFQQHQNAAHPNGIDGVPDFEDMCGFPSWSSFSGLGEPRAAAQRPWWSGSGPA